MATDFSTMNVYTMNKFLLTFAFLFTLLSVSQARTTLTASQPYGLRGEVVQVEVHYSSDSSEVVGAQFTLEYDPAQMTVGKFSRATPPQITSCSTSRKPEKYPSPCSP